MAEIFGLHMFKPHRTFCLVPGIFGGWLVVCLAESAVTRPAIGVETIAQSCEVALEKVM